MSPLVFPENHGLAFAMLWTQVLFITFYTKELYHKIDKKEEEKI